ncbi:hypothetical protein E2562_036559 [Oryza meyeriana var. granulata]|uniref:DUF4378 domain-containing protein n=1 Tax=Oryza meyeriana var. granulata TaxID=110450 RepID=A0A6G1EES7_9ORYZ|nr:hypothetical protein E2562_036559 [Oryza meyeriana var. granulata]
MPSRMMQAFAQEASDFDRQMGCMAGMFQIFDRRRLLTARQRSGGHGARGTPSPGHALPNSNSNFSIQTTAASNISLDKTFSKSMTENSSLSMESSSRASSSSSSCSSFSSTDIKKPVQQELSYINEERFVGKPPRSSESLVNCSKTGAKSKEPHTSFREIVKGSINRESHGLAIKTWTKESRKGLHKDSPRPLLISKSTDGTYVIGIDRSTGAYAHESSRPPRFSCDDRQLLRSVEAQDSKKPSAKLKELPRLSLDSRKESMNPRSSRLKKNSGYIRSDDNLLDVLKHQESPSLQRASSVVAKLMGLEGTPDIHEPSRSPRPVHDTQNDRLSHCHRSKSQDHRVPLPTNHSPVLKTNPSPRILPEAAPWRQNERAVTGHEAEVKPRNASIYADIQRRLRGLELSECNKELRALRILSTLHKKDSPSQSDSNPELTTIQKEASEQIIDSEKFQSPIVIMKPARCITKPDASHTLVAPLSRPKGVRRLRHEETSFTRKNENCDRKRNHSPNESAHSSGEEPVNSSRSPGLSSSLSPRLAQKKADSERRSRPPVLPMSPGKKSKETVSPRGRLRSRHSQAKSISDDDDVLQIPEIKISLAKQIDVGVIDQPNPLSANSSYIHQSNIASTPSHEEMPAILPADKKKIHPQENIPSPVSVLDATFCHEGSSPSLKRISDSFKDGETHTSDENWNPTSLPDTPPSKTSNEGNQIKPENMKALIQKLELLQMLSEKALKTDETFSSVAANKDHQYLYEILSASGLLHNKINFQMMPHHLRPSTYPINPELFLILEQAKPDEEKLHRRHIFDLANELLAQQMDVNHTAKSSVQFSQSKKLSGWQLFKDLCADIDRIQSESSMIRCSEEEDSRLAEDAVQGMKEWKSSGSELQGIVLAIEKSIFKDLIDETISGEDKGKVHLTQWKLRRQLSFISI